MKKYLEKSGKTEDEALAAALRELGLDRDDVSVEIVERAKSGFLGIGASPAVVRVEYDAPDEEPVKEAPAAPVSEPPRAEKKAEKAAEPAAPAVSTEPKYTEGVAILFPSARKPSFGKSPTGLDLREFCDLW